MYKRAYSQIMSQTRTTLKEVLTHTTLSYIYVFFKASFVMSDTHMYILDISFIHNSIRCPIICSKDFVLLFIWTPIITFSIRIKRDFSGTNICKYCFVTYLRFVIGHMKTNFNVHWHEKWIKLKKETIQFLLKSNKI